MSTVFLADSIAGRLLADFGASEALPSERKLSEYYNCNRMTVRRAIKMLNEKGLVVSSRRGHMLAGSPQETPAAAAGVDPDRPAAVMVLSIENYMLDHTHTFLLGGIFHACAQLGLNVIFRELGESEIAAMKSFRDIDRGERTAGYIVACQAPMKLHDLLSNSMKPCVINGNFIGQEEQPERIRFTEVRIDYKLLFREIGLRLLREGHRKMLLAHPNRGFMLSRIQEGLERARFDFGVEEQVFTTGIYPVNIFAQSESVRQVARQLAADSERYTALLLPCGNIFGLETVRALHDRKISIPERLSLVMLGYETDYFMNTYDISGVYGDVRELGAFCVKALHRQLRSGKLEFGVNYFSTSFIDRGTIAPPTR
jgi:DNA-binding LacI/PurR family transcriptional regulator